MSLLSIACRIYHPMDSEEIADNEDRVQNALHILLQISPAHFIPDNEWSPHLRKVILEFKLSKTTLTKPQVEELATLLLKYENVWTEENKSDPIHHVPIEMLIDTQGHDPIRQKLRKQGVVEKQHYKRRFCQHVQM